MQDAASLLILLQECQGCCDVQTIKSLAGAIFDLLSKTPSIFDGIQLRQFLDIMREVIQTVKKSDVLIEALPDVARLIHLGISLRFDQKPLNAQTKRIGSEIQVILSDKVVHVTTSSTMNPWDRIALVGCRREYKARKFGRTWVYANGTQADDGPDVTQEVVSISTNNAEPGVYHLEFESYLGRGIATDSSAHDIYQLEPDCFQSTCITIHADGTTSFVDVD